MRWTTPRFLVRKSVAWQYFTPLVSTPPSIRRFTPRGAATQAAVNQGQRPVSKKPENEQPKADAKEEFRREKFDVPGTRRTASDDDNQMQGIAKHGNSLPQKRFARVAVSV